MSNYWLIIPAAGRSNRMRSDIPKQYLTLHKKTVIEHSVHAFLPLTSLQRTIVAIASDDLYWQKTPLAINPRVMSVTGGDSRMLSVYHALLAIQDRAQAEDWILIHDAARPNIRWHDIEKLIHACEDEKIGGILATPVTATLKQVNASQYITNTIVRDAIWQALTPQCFRYHVLLTALNNALTNNIHTTDESMAIELLGQQPKVIAGRADNLKITYPEDLALLEFLMAKK